MLKGGPSRLCDLCGVHPADLRYREVSGWEETRAQGGANKIIARRDTGRRACRGCIEKVRRGLSIEQGTML